MKRVVLSLLVILIAIIVPVLVFEGGNSLAKWRKPHLSLSYQLISRLGLSGPEMKAGQEGAYAAYFSDSSELFGLMDEISSNSIGIGNAPFQQLQKESAAINTIEPNGCPSLKPNLKKTAFFLRTSAFNPLEPVSVFYDVDKKIGEPVKSFFDLYRGRKVTISSNGNGERVTVPLVLSPRKVLVAGDSVAFGAMIDDSETLPSMMQAADQSRQYINLGVAGIDAEAIICRLEAAAERYAGEIDELIYIYCENDLKPQRPYGTPDKVIAWLQTFAKKNGITNVRVVFSPYIYLLAPEITRFEGYFGATYPLRRRERMELASAVKASGFAWTDIGLVAIAEAERLKTPFAVLSLFVDHNHLSPRGNELVMQSIRGNN